MPSLRVTRQLMPSLRVTRQLMPSLRVTRQLMPSLRDTRQLMPSLRDTRQQILSLRVVTYKVKQFKLRRTSLHEFDDLLPKPFSTDSDSDHYLYVESTGATISSQVPPPTVPTSSQTSIPPSTPGITDSLFSLEITDCSRGRKLMGRSRKRIYTRRHKVGIPNIGGYLKPNYRTLSPILPNILSIYSVKLTHV